MNKKLVPSTQETARALLTELKPACLETGRGGSKKALECGKRMSLNKYGCMYVGLFRMHGYPLSDYPSLSL